MKLKLALAIVAAALLTGAGPPPALSAPWPLLQQQSTAPDDFDRVAARAGEARGANRIEEAVELYRKAVALRPRWAEGWWYLGTLLYERDAFADAADAFGRATTLSPNVGSAWVMLGLCEFKLGRFDDALTHIQQGRRLGINADPQFRRVVLYHEGLLQIGMGAFERAQDTLSQLSREGSENEEQLIALGLSVLRLRFSELLAGDAALRDAVRRAGGAEHLAAQKKFDEARREYESLATDFPKVPNVHYALGRYLLVTNQDEQAVAAFRREIENSPGHLLARLWIADTKFRLRDAAGGLPYAEEAVKINPQLPLGHYLLGLLLLETGQTARSIAELEKARAGLPDEPKIHYALGRAYARANRKEDAESARAAFTRLSKKGTDPDTNPIDKPAPR